MFLGYLAYPARKSSPRDKMPWFDWVFALIAGFCGAYLFFFYRELATRPGIPTLMDVVVASAGLLLLLEVTRRALGAPMAVQIGRASGRERVCENVSISVVSESLKTHRI